MVVVSSLLGAFVVVMTGTLVSFFTLGGVNGVEADLVLPLFFPSSCVKEELVLNIFFNLLNPEFCCSGEPTELSSVSFEGQRDCSVWSLLLLLLLLLLKRNLVKDMDRVLFLDRDRESSPLSLSVLSGIIGVSSVFIVVESYCVSSFKVFVVLLLLLLLWLLLVNRASCTIIVWQSNDYYIGMKEGRKEREKERERG